MPRTFAQPQPLLARDEGHGEIGDDRRTAHRTAIATKTRGDVDGQHGTPRCIDGVDQLRHLRAYVGIESDAEQRIDDDVAARQAAREFLRGVGEHRHSRSDALVRGSHGITLEPLAADEGHDARRQPRTFGEACEHVAVTSIVASPAEHQQIAGDRPARA